MLAKVVTALGEIVIDESVIARVAASVASESYGVVGLAFRSAADSVASLLLGETASKGVKVLIEDDGAISISLHIVTQYGLNISAICESIIHNVRYKVTQMTGFTVKKVTAHVESIRSAN